MSEAPQPRLCHIKRWPHYDGYGFTLHNEKKEGIQLIGKIDEDSPAEAGGLRPSDRIIEINGVNVTRENHKQVVQRIKSGGDETRLLVADSECQDYHNEREIVIKSSLPYILYLSSEKKGETSSDSEEEEEPVRQQNVVRQAIESDEGVEEISNDHEEEELSERDNNREEEGGKDSSSSSSSSSSDEEAPIPRRKPATQYKSERASYNKNELVAGLHLNMSAKEMRQRVGSVKKTDPRVQQIALKEKYKIINSL